MKKLVITGPECSGKSTLASMMSQKLKGVLVPEIARPLLTLTGNSYSSSDLLTIAEYQTEAEFSAQLCDTGWVICDTSLLVLKIWSQVLFDRCDPWIEQHFQNSSALLWLLCEPLPFWQADGQRNNPNDRNRLFELYQNELIVAGKNFLIVPTASADERFDWVINQISEL
ncbi:MAG: ATP-binding protein [Saprospiraceae bacterium]|nr:ATP-binding protein [Saprospiraceae bacterium]